MLSSFNVYLTLATRPSGARPQVMLFSKAKDESGFFKDGG